MYLFAVILAEFFTLDVTVNSFHELEVHGSEHREIYLYMASEDRTSAADLSGFLSGDARRFSAFQTIALAENQFDDGREVGTHEHAADEKLLFEVDHTLDFRGWMSFPSENCHLQEKAEKTAKKGITQRVWVIWMHGIGKCTSIITTKSARSSKAACHACFWRFTGRFMTTKCGI